jgi:hypothetical protein
MITIHAGHKKGKAELSLRLWGYDELTLYWSIMISDFFERLGYTEMTIEKGEDNVNNC